MEFGDEQAGGAGVPVVPSVPSVLGVPGIQLKLENKLEIETGEAGVVPNDGFGQPLGQNPPQPSGTVGRVVAAYISGDGWLPDVPMSAHGMEKAKQNYHFVIMQALCNVDYKGQLLTFTDLVVAIRKRAHPRVFYKEEHIRHSLAKVLVAKYVNEHKCNKVLLLRLSNLIKEERARQQRVPLQWRRSPPSDFIGIYYEASGEGKRWFKIERAKEIAEHDKIIAEQLRLSRLGSGPKPPTKEFPVNPYEYEALVHTFDGFMAIYPDNITNVTCKKIQTYISREVGLYLPHKWKFISALQVMELVRLGLLRGEALGLFTRITIKGTMGQVNLLNPIHPISLISPIYTPLISTGTAHRWCGSKRRVGSDRGL